VTATPEGPVDDRLVEPRLGSNRLVIIGGLAAAFIGAGGLALAFAANPRQAGASYLVAYNFGASTALGALITLMIGHATNATWIIPIRRPFEAIAATLPAFAVLFVPIALEVGEIFPWVRPASRLPSRDIEKVLAKQAYLHPSFFIGRAIAYLVIWSAIALLLRRFSKSEDEEPSASAIGRQRVVSAIGFPLVGITLTLAAWDWVMSLEPTFNSTMFGLDWFAGGFTAALALGAILVWLWDRARILPAEVSPSHFHALGKLLLTATIFWAYIVYFQGMLAWIADIPEESAWYVHRTSGAWFGLAIAIIFTHFAIPFFLLLSRNLKRRAGRLAAVGGLLLLAHYLEMYWLVLPAFPELGPQPHWASAAALVAVLGVAVAYAGVALRGSATAPWKDPRFAAGLRYETA
jgi:hypothetical protein